MATIMDYIHWRGDLDFNQSEFNILDNLCFCEMCFMDYEGLVSDYPSSKTNNFGKVLKKLMAQNEEKKIVLGLVVPNTIVDFVDIAKDTKRFGRIRVSNYINFIATKEPTQFSAITYHLDENTIYIAFRGTDDTLIGWQENLNMLNDVASGAPLAKDYVNRIAKQFPNTKIYIGGHSKGGNLANYAMIYANKDVQERIVACYTNDGPGFDPAFIDKEKFLEVKDKIIHIMPEDDVVGLLFKDFSGHVIVCKSNGKGVFQHDGFSWLINVTDFDTIPKVSEKAKRLEKGIKKLVASLDEEEKNCLSENFYNFILATNKNTLLDCKRDTITLLKNLNKLDKKSTQLFSKLLREFIVFDSKVLNK